MPPITKLDVLMRVHVELPEGLELPTEDFREGWRFVRATNARRVEQQISASGWSYIKIADQSLRSGVGDTSEEAIANALMITLRHVHTHFNAAEVEHIRLTQYPWFYLARVRVNPCIIRQSADLPVPYPAALLPVMPRQRRSPARAAALYPIFNSNMPELRQMLILSKTARVRQQ